MNEYISKVIKGWCNKTGCGFFERGIRECLNCKHLIRLSVTLETEDTIKKKEDLAWKKHYNRIKNPARKKFGRNFLHC